MTEFYNVAILTMLVFAVPAFRRRFIPAPIPDNAGPAGRILFFDMLKGLSILAVICIHVGYFYFHSRDIEANTFFLVFTNNFLRFAIPVFFICSGLLLSLPPPGRTWFDFYKNKFLRVFLPYLLLCALYWFYHGYSASEFAFKAVSGTIDVPFYFLVLLAQFYLVYPFIQKLARERYFVFLSFAFSLLCFFNINTWYLWGVILGGKFFFFFVYGIYLRSVLDFSGRGNKKPDTWFWLVLIFLYLLLMLLIFDKYYNTRYFYGPAIFHVLFAVRGRLERRLACLAGLGRLSLWVYLVHFPLVGLAFYMLATSEILGFWPAWTLIFILSAAASIILASALSRLYARFLKNFSNSSKI